MLDEAVHVIRQLFTGQLITHSGRHYRVDTARLYSVPDLPPPVFMSGFGAKAIKLAARIADGYMSIKPDAESVRLYRESGGGSRTVQGGLKVCWAPDESAARKTAHRLWPNDADAGPAQPGVAVRRALSDAEPLNHACDARDKPGPVADPDSDPIARNLLSTAGRARGCS
jgi:G6PDH family F420-dependent oxidoreductase